MSMHYPNYQPNFNQPAANPARKRLSFHVFLAVALLVSSYAAVYWVNSTTSDIVTDDSDPSVWKRAANIFPFGQNKIAFDEPEYAMPSPESTREDILVLGIRGEDDPDGGSLTDTMILFSFDKATGKSALASIPRDLYVKITPTRMEKINAAYENLGLSATRKLLSRITGVYVDNIIVFDFSSFKQIVDDLGGIDIVLDKPFTETTQWGYEFSLPAGPNHLDGQNALYYVRSRYSTSDFDRARRQQQVIFAIKDKALATNLLDEPAKALSLLTTIKANVDTDINLFDISGLIKLAKAVNPKGIKHSVISTDNLLVEGRENGMYVLTPKEGSLMDLKSFFKNILL